MFSPCGAFAPMTGDSTEISCWPESACEKADMYCRKQAIKARVDRICFVFSDVIFRFTRAIQRPKDYYRDTTLAQSR